MSLQFPSSDADIAARKEKLASAYLDLENPIRDVYHMSKIVNEIVADIGMNDDKDIRDRAAWAIYKLCDYADDLRAIYHSPTQDDAEHA